MIINVRWADNTADLAKHLKEGLNQIEATKASVEKLVQSLSGDKLIAAAHRYTAAVQQIGGAEKLTIAEKARINDLLSKAIEKYSALGKVAPDAMRQLAQETAKVEAPTNRLVSLFADMGKTVAATATGFLSAQAIIGGVKTAFAALTRELEKLTLQGAAVADVEENFRRLTTQAGLLGESLLGVLRQGTHNTITDFELMKTVNQDLAAGLRLTDEQFGVLAKGAFALAQATGTDVKSALDTMNDAMLTGRTRALALLTGKIDLEKAEEAYARSLGSTREHLTEEGKLEAARAAILDSVAQATARLGDQTDGLDERVAQLQTAWQNFEEELGKTIATSDVLTAGLDSLRDAFVATFGGNQEALVRAVARAVDDVAIQLVDLAQTGVTAAGFLVKEFLAVYKLFGNLAQIVDGNVVAFKYLALQAAKVTFDTEGITRINGELDMLMLRMTERGKALQEADRLQESADKGAAAFNQTLREMRDRMAAARAAHVDFVGPLEETVRGTTAATQAGADRNRLLQQTTSELNAAEKAERTRIKALEDARQSELAMGRQALMTNESLRGLAVTGGLIADSYELARQKMDAFTAVQPTQTKFGLDEFFTMGTVPTPSMADFKETFSTAIAGVGRDVPGLLIKAFTGGGGLNGAANAIGTTFGQKLFGPDGAFASFVGKASTGLTNLFGKTIGGALAAAIPGVGALIGPAIQGLGKLFKKIFGGPSEEVVKARGEQDKLIEGFREMGYAGSDFDVLAQGIGDTFRDIGKDGESARRVLEMALDTDHPERYAQAVKEINAALAEQKSRWEGVQEAAADLNAFTQAGIDTQGKFNLAAGSAIAIFDAWVQKTGDVVGALNQIGPTLDVLKTAETDLGFAGNAAIDQLLRLREVTAANQPLIESIGQSTRLLQSLGKAGLLTKDLVISFGQNAVNQFTLLKKATGNATEALTLMQPELQALWEHQQKFHDITDEATLSLLKEAETQGVVGEDMKNVNEQVLDVLKAIAKVLGAEIPSAARRAADGIQDNLDGLNPQVTVDVTYDDPGFTPDYQAQPGFAARGGIVRPYGIQTFATGGIVQVPPVAAVGMRAVAPVQYLATGGSVFQPRGTDTVPAMLSPGEEVTSVRDRSTFLAGLTAVSGRIDQLTALLAEPRPLVLMVDSREFARTTLRVIDNGGVIRTEWREALGVT